ncbi:hypothetical protein FACS18949_04200 [Clostridia bacterium]|nr:hypothetical protein FACS189425_08900 [Clostridia bacterium]GHV32644.1 hypothetical protein FACS18949_04200 [Clostridia bacterium]
MTANEYAQFVLEVKKETSSTQEIDEVTAYEAAQLISGSFTYPLYEALWINHFDIDTATQHLENLYDSGNHFGLIYFIFILAEAVDFTVPSQFTEMSATDALVPVLAAAIIEDWLEYDSTSEPTEYEG